MIQQRTRAHPRLHSTQIRINEGKNNRDWEVYEWLLYLSYLYTPVRVYFRIMANCVLYTQESMRSAFVYILIAPITLSM